MTGLVCSLNYEGLPYWMVCFFIQYRVSCLHLFQKNIFRLWSIELALSGEYDVFGKLSLSIKIGGLFPSESRIHEAGQAQIGNGLLLLGIVLLERLLAGVGKLTSVWKTDSFSQCKSISSPSLRLRNPSRQFPLSWLELLSPVEDSDSATRISGDLKRKTLDVKFSIICSKEWWGRDGLCWRRNWWQEYEKMSSYIVYVSGKERCPSSW